MPFLFPAYVIHFPSVSFLWFNHLNNINPSPTPQISQTLAHLPNWILCVNVLDFTIFLVPSPFSTAFSGYILWTGTKIRRTYNVDTFSVSVSTNLNSKRIYSRLVPGTTCIQFLAGAGTLSSSPSTTLTNWQHRSTKLTTHFHLAPQLKLYLHSLNTFVAWSLCTGTTFSNIRWSKYIVILIIT
jgi:hypothetical protein